jgi:apolipoprotein N-acyltransferase
VLPGHIWIGLPPGQTAALWGATGLTLLTLLAAALPVVARGAGLAAAVALLAGAWAWGAVRLAAPLPPEREATLRLVQPNAAQAAKWDPDLAGMFFRRLLALSSAPPAPGAPPPRLVIWPETSVPWLLDRSPELLPVIGAAGQGAPVVVGIQRTDGGRRGWNTLAVVTPAGALGAVYDKHHLVPFGEYMPAGDWLDRILGIRALAAAEGFGFSAGEGPAVIDFGPGLGRAVPLICYEVIFPGIPRTAQTAEGRADWLVQITNDAWFGTLTGPYQHLALARLRAVEQGLPLLRAANTGISAVIDARGGLAASLPLGAQGAIDAALPGALPPTPYARWGEGPVGVLLGLCALGLAIAARRPRP